jgi:hypothetical protein
MTPELEENLRTVSDPRTLVDKFGWNDPPPGYVSAMPEVWERWASGRADRRAFSIMCTNVNGLARYMHFKALDG